MGDPVKKHTKRILKYFSKISRNNFKNKTKLRQNGFLELKMSYTWYLRNVCHRRDVC